MSHTVDTKEYLDTVVSLLSEGKDSIPVPIEGNSMRPFLKKGDTVYLSPLDHTPKRGDVVLYTRRDGSYVLHRVAKKEKSGVYLMLGDSQATLEPVSKDRVLAEATSAVRIGKHVNKKSPVWFFFRWIYPQNTKMRVLLSRIARIFNTAD